MKFKKTFALLLAAVMLLTLIGCKKTILTGTPSQEINFTGYPIQTNETLTYWVTFDSQTAQKLSDTPFGKERSSQTGIDIKYIHPPQGQETEQFNILLASDELPDIMEGGWYGFSGGPGKAIDEQIIIPLNDAFDKYSPNMKKYLQEHPEIDKMIKTDNGSYYCYPFIRGDDKLLVSYGPIVREDWLNELGLSVPETIDEWYNILTQFKEKKNASAPLSFTSATASVFAFGAFTGAYGMKYDFFVENNNVVYGPADQRYKDFLITFSQWYKEGLVDYNIVNVDSTMLTSNLLRFHRGYCGICGRRSWNLYKNTARKRTQCFVCACTFPFA